MVKDAEMPFAGHAMVDNDCFLLYLSRRETVQFSLAELVQWPSTPLCCLRGGTTGSTSMDEERREAGQMNLPFACACFAGDWYSPGFGMAMVWDDGMS